MLKKSPYVLPPVRPLPNIELIEAAKRGDVAGVRAALSAGAFINTRDAASKSAMHYAAAGRHVAALRELCANEENDLFAVDAAGFRPMHYACVAIPGMPLAASDDPAAAELLTLRGENAGVRAEGGDTPLILCARWGQHAIADYLLNLPSAFSKAASTYGSAGLTAAETARTWGFDALADMIETRGAVAKRE